MRGSFNGSQSPYVYDQGKAAFYREQEEQRRLRDRIARSTLWLSVRLAGQSYPSESDLLAAVVALAEAEGMVFDDELAHVITEATTALWQTGRYLAPAVAA